MASRKRTKFQKALIDKKCFSKLSEETGVDFKRKVGFNKSSVEYFPCKSGFQAIQLIFT